VLSEHSVPLLKARPHNVVEQLGLGDRLDQRVRGDHLVDRLVGPCNLVEGLGARHDNLARAEYAGRHLLLFWFRRKLDLDGAVPVRVERHLEGWTRRVQPSSSPGPSRKLGDDLVQIDRRIQREIGVDHLDTRLLSRWELVELKNHLQNKGELAQDTLTIEQVRTPCDLNRPVGKQLDTFA